MLINLYNEYPFLHYSSSDFVKCVILKVSFRAFIISVKGKFIVHKENAIFI